jgi:hypothetical protein
MSRRVVTPLGIVILSFNMDDSVLCESQLHAIANNLLFCLILLNTMIRISPAYSTKKGLN